MHTLLYLGYASRPHLDEIAFSILSALHRAGPKPSFRVVICSDVTQAFEHLSVELKVLDQKRRKDWSGQHGYTQRRKLMVLADALQVFAGPGVFVDEDTRFAQSPDCLFDQIAPGHSLLHLPEGRLSHVQNGAGYAELVRYLTSARLVNRRGSVLAMPQDMVIGNPGVVALRSRDAHLPPKAVHLTDHHWAQFRRVPTIEQFMLNCVLERGTREQTWDGIVFHHWMDALERRFRQRLPARLFEARSRPTLEGAGRAYRDRSRPRLRRRCRLAVVHRPQDWRLMRRPMRWGK